MTFVKTVCLRALFLKATDNTFALDRGFWRSLGNSSTASAVTVPDTGA